MFRRWLNRRIDARIAAAMAEARKRATYRAAMSDADTFWLAASWYDQQPELTPATIDAYIRDGEDPTDRSVQLLIWWRYMRARYGAREAT